MTRDEFDEKVDEMLTETLIPAIKERCGSLFASGGVDADDFENNFLLPKIVLHVTLHDVADSIRPLSGYKVIAENLRNF